MTPITTILAAASAAVLLAAPNAWAQQSASSTIKLPAPRHEGTISLEASLWARHSTRALRRDSLTLAEVGQLLWAAQGVNRSGGHRTTPSAMAMYPLELYLVASRVRGVPPGVYHYRPASHDLDVVAAGDKLPDLVSRAAHASWIGDAAVVVVFAAAYARVEGRFGAHTETFIGIEAGAATQDVYLEAAELGLGTTYVGSAEDSALVAVVSLPQGERPVGIMPVGRPR